VTPVEIIIAIAVTGWIILSLLWLADQGEEISELRARVRAHWQANSVDRELQDQEIRHALDMIRILEKRTRKTPTVDPVAPWEAWCE
jgi:hypothetical protein